MSSSASQKRALREIEYAIGLCQSHLDGSSSRGSEIEAYLTKYLLILICSSYEHRIREMIIERARRTNDSDLASFVDRTYHSSQRGLKISDIRGNLLKRFSDKYVTEFDKKIKPNDVPCIKYSNIVENRHAAAHGGTVNMTFNELVDSYKIAEAVMTSLSEILGP
jgi:hypothetical protein